MIMRVFPEWAKRLNLGDCGIHGIDLALHDEAEHYREAVAFIKTDPLSLGALVTTHKIDLLRASRDMFDEFDELDEFASLMGEVSSLSKSEGRLVGAAKDPITAGSASISRSNTFTRRPRGTMTPCWPASPRDHWS